MSNAHGSMMIFDSRDHGDVRITERMT
jgi:hypothetical protein